MSCRRVSAVPRWSDPDHERLDAAAVETVRGEWLDGLLEGDDQVRQRCVGQRELLVPAGFGPTGVYIEAAGDGEPSDAPGAGGVQRVEQAGRVRAEVADRVLVGDGTGEVDDVADVVATGEGEEGVPVGYVEGLHGDPAGGTTGLPRCAATTTSALNSLTCSWSWSPGVTSDCRKARPTRPLPPPRVRGDRQRRAALHPLWRADARRRRRATSRPRRRGVTQAQSG
jgi:hypothetical protein